MIPLSHSALWPVARDAVDVRAWLLEKPLPHFPDAVLYVSTPIGDPRLEAFVDYVARAGLPRTSTYTDDDGPGYELVEARPGWRLTISPARRLMVTGRGHCLVDVTRTSAPDDWICRSVSQGRALVIVGGPVPFMAGPGHSVADLLTWVCTHPTAGGIMPVREAP